MKALGAMVVILTMTATFAFIITAIAGEWATATMIALAWLVATVAVLGAVWWRAITDQDEMFKK